MTDQVPPSAQIPDSEAIATAKLVLPLVLTRLESDPVWSLAMLNAVRLQLDIDADETATVEPLDTNDLLNMPAGKALAEAHKFAVKDELANATTLAQLALRNPEALGDAKTNARLLLASLLERQGRLVEAAQTVAKACRDDPDNANALGDRSRIIGKLRSDAQAGIGASKAERVSMLASVLEVAGWNFSDAKALFIASCGLLRGS